MFSNTSIFNFIKVIRLLKSTVIRVLKSYAITLNFDIYGMGGNWIDPIGTGIFL